MKRSTTGIEKDIQRLSILSRFNSPFGPKKPRNVSEYSIELDETYKTFAPGDRVTGHVILNVERPVRITHLTICLHGVVKVLKNGRIPSESTNRWRSYLATGQGKWGEAYFGNGLAALFKDEVVLAGDGCLAASSYRFNFDLELPAERLPSSIDFQHGCISYMLSSTLTRPTTLRPSNFLPTSRVERIIMVKETINVANLTDSVPQVISLDTIHRRPRRTKITIAGQLSEHPNPERSQQSSTPTFLSSTMSEASDESPQSPSISEVSCASNVSRDVNDFEDCFESATRYGNANIEGHSTTSSDEAAIPPRASVHMLQSGCLPGDTVSVQVAINIGKHFRNPQGIILTLYRECHIDIHPAIPLGSWQNGSKEEYEDYYPKSRTGLGGLSLSSGGTSRVFRQDISQKTTALYVDKRTLTATVKASVHVPDGVFPTISTVPGKMIDFKYYVETIIDLRGKSAIQERILPRLSMVNAVSSFSPSESGLCPHGTYESENLRLDSGLAFLDTSQLRREKGVVTHIAEVIVGTRDSRRRRLKKIDHGQAHGEPPTESLQDYTSSTNDDVDHDLRENGRFFHYDIDDLHPNLDDQLEALQAVDFAPAQDVPAPEIEERVDEKTRLQRAEELLLPSAPPQGEELMSSDRTPVQPSAPAAFDGNTLMQDPGQPGPSAPAYHRLPVAPQQNTTFTAPLIATSEERARAAADSHLEDKQELERRRLQAQASSPSADPVGNDALSLEASAPVLDEDTVVGHWPHFTGDEHTTDRLPRYQA